jgi:hypothetical protein
MLVVQFGLGSYVSLYVTVPGADHSGGFGKAIANGPAGLTVHIVLGLLLVLAAIGALVQATVARHPGLIAGTAIGLLAMLGAAASGGTFVSSGRDAASLVMAILTAVGLLSYGSILFRLPRPQPAGES